MAAKRYFHIKAGRETGPYTAADLQGMARRGAILPDDLIRPEDSPRSYPARNVVGLFENRAPANSPQPPGANSGPSPIRQAVASHAGPSAPATAATNRPPLIALLAALADLQREELTRQVVRGERTAADAERRGAELTSLLRAVEGQATPARGPIGLGVPRGAASVVDDSGARVQHTAANTSPIYVPSSPPPPTDNGLGTALGIGAAALLAGGAGMAIGRAFSQPQPPPSPPPQPPAPPRESSPNPGIAQVSRALWQMRSRVPGDTFAADPPTADAHIDHGHQELTHHDIPTADPIPDAEIVDAQPTFDSSPSSGLSWDYPAPSSETFASGPPVDIPTAEPIEQEGSFFGDLFGFGNETETEVDAGSGGDDWLGADGGDVVETDGGLGDALDTGDVDTGDLDVDFSDGGGFEF